MVICDYGFTKHRVLPVKTIMSVNQSELHLNILIVLNAFHTVVVSIVGFADNYCSISVEKHFSQIEILHRLFCN